MERAGLAVQHREAATLRRPPHAVFPFGFGLTVACRGERRFKEFSRLPGHWQDTLVGMFHPISVSVGCVGSGRIAAMRVIPDISWGGASYLMEATRSPDIAASCGAHDDQP
jgi:hypothetical protein